MTIATNAEHLRQIAERVTEATPGPWTAKDLGRWDFAIQPKEGQDGQTVELQRNARAWLVQADGTDQWSMVFVDDQPDAAFIAAAREDIPFLLSEISKLNAEKAETIEVLEALLEEPWIAMNVHYQRYDHQVIGCHYCGWSAKRAERTHADDCVYMKAKPLLDKLKGSPDQTKEGS